jgi:magnesium chelatase subunit D
MIDVPPGPTPWSDAALAALLFAIDPVGLGGVNLRAAPGPTRDAWLRMTRNLLPPEAPFRRAPATIADDGLLGGLDLPASLAAGRAILQPGVLAQADGGVVVFVMAERLGADAAGRTAATMDAGRVVLERDGLARAIETRFGVITLDEGQAPEEHPPGALLDRLAFHLDLTVVGPRAAQAEVIAQSVTAARGAWPNVAPAPPDIVEALCAIADLCGVHSLRAPVLALAAARAHAALRGREEILPEDAAIAARLVIGPRALAAPLEAPAEPATPQDPAPDPSRSDAADPQDARGRRPDPAEAREIVLEAVKAALPDDLLQRIAFNRARGGAAPRSNGAGAAARSARRGRPRGALPGRLAPGVRLSLTDTLRAAAPWQNLRRAPVEARLQIRPSDFRVKRFRQRLESTTIFVVDASGSAALQRLAEAKGAVELLLAKAYVNRARVALIAFRGAEADLLLAPTRSLTRAKRRLADLPGGGSTPLASALDRALRLALAERAADRTPLLVLLTDGRANVDLAGAPGRPGAEADALAAARRIALMGVSAIHVDTSARPQPQGDKYALAMGGAYAALPYLDARAVRAVVEDFRDAETRRAP